MKDSKSTTRECIAKQYEEPAKIFTQNVAKLGDVSGIQAPHIPIAGANYDRAEYKIAFVGMETYGWDDLERFINGMEVSPWQSVLKYQDWLNPIGILKGNGNATFWGFIIRFLETFYKIEHQKILNRRDPHPILSSFVWAETNAIERYHVTAEKNGVDREIWEKVKEYSKPLDNIEHLITATKPKVVIITDKWVSENYIFSDNDDAEILPKTKYFALKLVPDEDVKYQYYYLREQDAHVFVIPHPRWLGLHKLTDIYINSIIKIIEDYKIWKKLPQKEEDWQMLPTNKSSKKFKYEFVGNLANLLASNNMTMTGVELAMLFNTNRITPQSSKNYSTKNGRGILTKVVTLAYQDYMDKSDRQTAQNIAKVFRTKTNNIAWE